MLAIVPAVTIIASRGEGSAFDLLIFSQVVLSLQLPFAVVPLIGFTSDKSLMGEFANSLKIKIIAGISAVVIVVLNARLVFDTLSGWLRSAGGGSLILWLTVVLMVLAMFLLLVYISLPKSWRKMRPAMLREKEELDITPRKYSKIGVALDLGELDAKVLSHAQVLAKQQGATLVLMHIVEGVGGQIFGKQAYDDEARDDIEHLQNHSEQLKATGLEVEAILGYGRVPKEIIRISRDYKIDLLVMGGHGHRGIKDIIFGSSVSKVRHGLNIPVLVIQ
jgi:manganese transport protein